MAKRHLLTLNAPKSWPIARKETVFVTRPFPSGYKLSMSLPISILLRDILKHGKTEKDIRSIMNNKEVIVNNVRRKDSKYAVGLFEVIYLKDIEEIYRIVLNKRGQLAAVAIEKHEADIVPCKIIGKSTLKKGKVQLNLMGGLNLIVEKDEYKVGDTIIINTKSKNKVHGHLKLEKGNTIYLMGGKHIGETGVVENIKGDKIIFKNDKGETSETLKEYAFVIGKEKPIIRINME